MLTDSSPGLVLHVERLPSAVWSLSGLCYGVRFCRWGCTLENLRPVNRASQRTDRCLVRIALINVRSVVNKTFILNDFFTSYSLDFLLLTETWLKPGKNSAFSVLLPPNCSFFSFLSSFHSTCPGILDTIAPFRQKSAKPRTNP